MSKAAKTLQKVLRGNSDANIRFGDLCGLLERLGFESRIRGDHHIFTRSDIVEIINIQPRGDKAKAYQVKQVRGLIVSYHLAVAEESQPSPDETGTENTNE
jgi:predicted RNA binding protein YcfA (HicA-like mRNA interferase family)